MTEKDIISQFGIKIHEFDGNLMPDELGFYDPVTKVAFLSDQLAKKESRCYYTNSVTKNILHRNIKTLAFVAKTKQIET